MILQDLEPRRRSRSWPLARIQYFRKMSLLGVCSPRNNGGARDCILTDLYSFVDRELASKRSPRRSPQSVTCGWFLRCRFHTSRLSLSYPARFAYLPILGGTMVILDGSLTESRFRYRSSILSAQARGRPAARRVRGDGVPLVVRDRVARCRDLLRRLTRREAHAPRRADRPGDQGTRLVQPAPSPGTARARHADCAMDANDRLADVRRQHRHRGVERATTPTARATG